MATSPVEEFSLTSAAFDPLNGSIYPEKPQTNVESFGYTLVQSAIAPTGNRKQYLAPRALASYANRLAISTSPQNFQASSFGSSSNLNLQLNTLNMNLLDHTFLEFTITPVGLALTETVTMNCYAAAIFRNIIFRYGNLSSNTFDPRTVVMWSLMNYNDGLMQLRAEPENINPATFQPATVTFDNTNTPRTFSIDIGSVIRFLGGGSLPLQRLKQNATIQVDTLSADEIFAYANGADSSNISITNMKVRFVGRTLSAGLILRANQFLDQYVYTTRIQQILSTISQPVSGTASNTIQTSLASVQAPVNGFVVFIEDQTPTLPANRICNFSNNAISNITYLLNGNSPNLIEPSISENTLNTQVMLSSNLVVESGQQLFSTMLAAGKLKGRALVYPFAPQLSRNMIQSVTLGSLFIGNQSQLRIQLGQTLAPGDFTLVVLPISPNILYLTPSGNLSISYNA